MYVCMIYAAHVCVFVCIICVTHYATSRKVAGSFPDEVIEFFNRPNSSSRTTALGSTQPLTEMNTKNLPGGKGRLARKVSPPSVRRMSRKSEGAPDIDKRVTVTQ
jgi:hypothetical protein